MAEVPPSVKGMNDILPPESARWEWLEDKIRTRMSAFAFRNIRTPIVEPTALFVRGTGETTDIVEKEMYSFEDKLNGEALTLRPENTPGVARAAIEHNLSKYGLANRCARVRACEVPVLSLDDPASSAIARISAEIELSKQEDHAEVVVLGCAGMADLAARLSENHGLPVIDGVASAVKLAEAFGALGLKTSKIGAYAPPRPKPYLGSFAPFEPR